MNILITGASSGIGYASAIELINKGHNVIGIDIKDINIEKIYKTYICDITNKEDLLKIKNELKDNDIRLDIIINVAGIHKMASLVETDFESMKKVIDINLIGTMLVNNIFHELLIENGRIIIVTSEVATFSPMPFNGLYNVSKTALESYAQALRQELNLLNQKVITIRPGAIKTTLSDNSMTDTETLANNTVLYKNQANRFLGIAKKFMGKPLPPEKIGKFIAKIVHKKNPKISYNIHRNLGLVLLNILPKRMQCWIIKKLLNKKVKSN